MMAQLAPRTTITVDPQLRNQLKAAAALQGKGLRQYVEEVLRQAVKKQNGQTRTK